MSVHADLAWYILVGACSDLLNKGEYEAFEVQNKAIEVVLPKTDKLIDGVKDLFSDVKCTASKRTNADWTSCLQQVRQLYKDKVKKVHIRLCEGIFDEYEVEEESDITDVLGMWEEACTTDTSYLFKTLEGLWKGCHQEGLTEDQLFNKFIQAQLTEACVRISDFKKWYSEVYQVVLVDLTEEEKELSNATAKEKIRNQRFYSSKEISLTPERRGLL